MDDMLRDLLGRIDAKLDKLDSRVDDQGQTLVRVEAGYHEHHRRSLSNEEMVKLTREESKRMYQKLQAEIAPIKAHVAAFSGAGKALQLFGTIAALAVALIAVWKHLAH
jgi:hypothetical protein